MNIISQLGWRASTFEESSLVVPPGQVIRTEPPARSSLSPGSTVEIVVSTGLPMVVVPPVVSLTAPTTTVPVTTTTFQIVTTTELAVPRYKLYEYKGDNLRWDPCAGPVSIKLNPMGHLTGSEIDDWATLLREFAAEISSFTGLNVVYGGQTGTDFRLSHPGGRTSVDILIGFAQHGAAHISAHSSDNYWGGVQNYIDYNQTPGWWTMSAVDIQVATDSSYGSNLVAPKNSRTTYLMNRLGWAFGLDDPGDGIDTEIMSWGGSGSGTWNSPDWGEGDKIAFGLVGASNGCLY